MAYGTGYGLSKLFEGITGGALQGRQDAEEQRRYNTQLDMQRKNQKRAYFNDILKTAVLLDGDSRENYLNQNLGPNHGVKIRTDPQKLNSSIEMDNGVTISGPSKIVSEAAGIASKAYKEGRDPFKDGSIQPFLGMGLNISRKAINKENLDLTTSQKEYQMAKNQGFKGTFLDYKQALKTNPVTNINVPGDSLKNDLIRAKIDQIQASIDAQKNKDEEKKKKRKLVSSEMSRSAKNVVDEIGRANEIMENTVTSTGLTGALSSLIPGSPSYNLRGVLRTIKANVGFDKLQRMRDMSPTGGALGQVSDRELESLQSVITSLDPNMGEQELKRGLNKVKNFYQLFFDEVLSPNKRMDETDIDKKVSDMSDKELLEITGLGE